jgi:competence protein ComEA
VVHSDRSRAAEVLDELVRPATASRLSLATRWSSLAGSWPRFAAVAVVAVALVAVVLVLTVWRRPPPIDERLPLADADRTASSLDTAGDAAGETADPTTTVDGTGVAAPGREEDPPAQLVVHVAGAVMSPGVVHLAGGSRVVDAVRAAGGLRADADPDRTNLAAPLTDGQRVVVPVLGQPLPSDVVLPGAPVEPDGGSGADATGTAGPIDLNAATEAELDTLPGVGPATAQAIVAHREAEGPFRTVDDLLDVRGIGEAKLEAVRDLVTVGATP